MSRIDALSQPRKNIWTHALIWGFIYIVYTSILSFKGSYITFLQLNLVNIPLFMLAYYLLRHVQIPYLLNRGKLVLFVLSLIVTAAVCFFLYLFAWVYWLDALFGKDGEIPFLNASGCLVKTIRYYSPAVALLALESHHERNKELARINILKKEKIANELKFLKAQINPHFLFNTLNNLYSFVVADSPKAPDMILRLSAILDYVLYKSQKKQVLLQEEIETIDNFLELEKIRYGDRLTVEFYKNINANSYISPLILLSVVENAFKHGASGDIDAPGIVINISTEEDTVSCDVWNTKSAHNGEKNDAYKEGVGLSNIKRQLLLLYPDRHELTIRDSDNSFQVLLSITSKNKYE